MQEKKSLFSLSPTSLLTITLLNMEYILLQICKSEKSTFVMKPLQYYINMSRYHYTLEDIIHIVK
jgi:hypothetical protein